MHRDLDVNLYSPTGIEAEKDTFEYIFNVELRIVHDVQHSHRSAPDFPRGFSTSVKIPGITNASCSLQKLAVLVARGHILDQDDQLLPWFADKFNRLLQIRIYSRSHTPEDQRKIRSDYIRKTDGDVGLT